MTTKRRTFNARILADSCHAIRYLFRKPASPPLWTGQTCQAKGCRWPAECFFAVSYVTGRRGRVATRETPMCMACAEEMVALMQEQGEE